MKTKRTAIQHLTIKTLGEPMPNRENPVLVVGNAYGVMPYQDGVARSLAQNGFSASWFAFSGQDGTSGRYSRVSAVRDIALAVDFFSAQSKSKRISLLAHCAGSLMALEYLRTHPSNPVHEMIVYGLLYKASRRQKLAQGLFKKMGTEEALTQDDWEYDPIPAIKHCEIPILFCHPTDKLNLMRCTRDEMMHVQDSGNHVELTWFGDGYDNDMTSLPDFVNVYVDWLSRKQERGKVTIPGSQQ